MHHTTERTPEDLDRLQAIRERYRRDKLTVEVLAPSGQDDFVFLPETPDAVQNSPEKQHT